MLDKEFNEKTEQEFKAFLSSIGDSIVCVALDDIVKVHVHTNHPGQAFEKALEYGQLTKMKVDNMREEHGIYDIFNHGDDCIHGIAGRTFIHGIDIVIPVLIQR